ncbi:unnamed protein product, partial [Pocillopora meandrina]
VEAVKFRRHARIITSLVRLEAFIMRKVFLVLLGIAIVLLASAEGRKSRKRGGKGKGSFSRPDKKACVKNCISCNREGTCLECDDGFAKVTFPKRSKTVCVPCSKRRKKTALNPDMSKCPPVPTTDPSLSCPKKCSSCNNGVCLVCERNFALVTGRKNKTACIPCATGRNSKRIDKSQCDSGSCGKNCQTCTNGTCTECANGFELHRDKNMCKKIKGKFKIAVLIENLCSTKCSPSRCKLSLSFSINSCHILTFYPKCFEISFSAYSSVVIHGFKKLAILFLSTKSSNVTHN